MRAQTSFVVVALLTVNACRPADWTEIAAALTDLLAAKPLTSNVAVWTDVRAFYAQRGNAPAWVTDRRASYAMTALEVLRTAPDHGFAAADYDEPDLTEELNTLRDEGEGPGRIRRLAELDVRITTSMLALSRDVALGRTLPTSFHRHWKARRPAPNFVGALERAANGDLATWLDTLRPRHAEYVDLQQALKNLQGQLQRGGWPIVPSRILKPGESHPSVRVLRQRLAASGELGGDAATNGSPSYDKDIAAGVRAFQEHHAIKATGIADPATVAAMNVPLEDRIGQVVVNLERWRWMPDDFGARHFVINIPSYLLMAREDGKTVLDIRVVVGKPGNETPVFSRQLETVVFSPYWNVPDSIVEGETAPAAARDPNYLSRNGIDILRVSKSGATPVHPSDVDWDNPDEIKRLAFRQRPGSNNALGHVKFLLPNEFNVYLHDTPADALFARPGRAFSHGCIRVEEPETLAKYVLRDYPDWDELRIFAAMRSGVEQAVKVKEPIPVHIVYFTVWVDERGGLHFYPDVYQYDRDRHST